MTDRSLRIKLKEWFKTDNPTEKNTHWYSLRVWGDYKKNYNAEQYVFKGLRAPSDEEYEAWIDSGCKVPEVDGAPVVIHNEVGNGPGIELDGYTPQAAFMHWANYWQQQKKVIKEMERIAADKNAQANIQAQKIIALALHEFGHDPKSYKAHDVLKFVYQKYEGTKDEKTVFITTQRILFKMDEETTTRDAVLRIWNKYFI